VNASQLKSLSALLGIDLQLFVIWLLAVVGVGVVFRLVKLERRGGIELGVVALLMLMFFPMDALLWLVGLFVLLFQVVSQKPKPLHALGFGVLLFGGIVLPTVGGVLTASAIEAPRFFGHAAYLLYFYTLFAKRVVWVGYEWWFLGAKPCRISLARYLFGLPFLVGKSAVFSLTTYSESEGGCPPRWAEGLKTFAMAFLHLALLVVLVNMDANIIIGRGLLEALPVMSTPALWLVVLGNYFCFYLFRYGWDQLSVGAARVLGRTVGDNYHNPLGARNYAEFWRRWNVHYRELVVRLFYYPSILWLQRRFPERRSMNVVLAIGLTFLGHGVFMAWVRGVWMGFESSAAWLDMLDALLIYEFIETVFVSAALLAPKRKRFGRLGLVLGVVMTNIIRAVAIVFFLRNGINLEAAFRVISGLVG
jgi:hypothetical protein